MLSSGTAAPSFTLPDQDAEAVSLADFAGRWVVLWWYPKASTGGWTKEGEGFRDRTQWFKEAGAEILGASFDSPAENKFFAEARRLPFKLLSDTEREVGAAYDVLTDPSNRSAGRAQRVTYLIDPEGTIREAYKVEDIEMHPAKVLADLRAILGIKV